MAEPRITPGPWRLEENSDIATGPALRVFGGGPEHNYPVCVPVHPDDGRAIAMLPDLVKQLRLCAEVMRRDGAGQKVVRKFVAGEAEAMLRRLGAWP